MLSSVLRSKRAIQTNIAIMRTFVRLKEICLTTKELAQGLERLEAKFARHDKQIEEIFNAIRQLINPTPRERREIGFHAK